MKYNYTLFLNNTIKSLTTFPIDENQPIIESDIELMVGCDSVVDGMLIIGNRDEYKKKTEALNRKSTEIQELKTRLKSLSDDIVQDLAGEIVPNIEERKEEFVALHNELRALKGMEPRETKIL